MDPMSPKVTQWINEKRDPRSAHWQAGLEAVMELFLPELETGMLTPVHPLEEKDLPVFKAALEMADLSPGLVGAFLPPAIANAIVPPDSAEELLRIKKGRPSYKIIVIRPGKEDRILCAEVSEQATKPGIDLFQSGALLASFDYASHDICLAELTKSIRAHVWSKEKWQAKDHMAYTLNWFERTQYLGRPDVTVDKEYSFFHNPTLIKSNRVDALFLLIHNVLLHRFKDPEFLLTNPASKERLKAGEIGDADCQSLAQTHVLELLNFVKDLELTDFTNFTPGEDKGFKNEFVRTVDRLSADLKTALLS